MFCSQPQSKNGMKNYVNYKNLLASSTLKYYFIRIFSLRYHCVIVAFFFASSLLKSFISAHFLLPTPSCRNITRKNGSLTHSVFFYTPIHIFRGVYIIPYALTTLKHFIKSNRIKLYCRYVQQMFNKTD